MSGKIEEFEVPTIGAGPDAVVLGPDGNIWVAATDADKLLRVTPKGEIAVVADGISPGSKPLSISVRGNALWFSETAGSRIACLVPGKRVIEFALPNSKAEPRATVAHPDGSLWFVETGGDALGRVDADGTITEHPVGGTGLSLRGICVGPDGDLWFTENFANRIGVMDSAGRMRGRLTIPTPNSGARCIMAHSNGRLYFTQFDAGLIGEIYSV